VHSVDVHSTSLNNAMRLYILVNKILSTHQIVGTLTEASENGTSKKRIVTNNAIYSGGSRILIRGGNYRIVMTYRVQIH
jgi:hypothetical protein